MIDPLDTESLRPSPNTGPTTGLDIGFDVEMGRYESETVVGRFEVEVGLEMGDM
jgi:hypothetical protein